MLQEATDPDGEAYWIQTAKVRDGVAWAVPGDPRVRERAVFSLARRVMRFLIRAQSPPNEILVLVFRTVDESQVFMWSSKSEDEAVRKVGELAVEIESGQFVP